MKNLSSLLMAAAAFGALIAAPGASIAAPITYDFSGTVSGNQALTGTHLYTAAGGPNLTAISGSYSQSGTGSPVAGDAFAAGGQLVGNNRGADEMGVGVCFGNGCNNGHIDDNPEIDAGGREAVRLDISGLLSGYGGFTINADSATDGELLGIFAGNAAGTALGARLADATSAGGNVTITPTSNYLFFVADNYAPERWVDDALFRPEVRDAYRRLVEQGWTAPFPPLRGDVSALTGDDRFCNRIAAVKPPSFCSVGSHI